MKKKKTALFYRASRPKIVIKKASPVTSSMRHYKYITKYLLAKQNRLLKSLIFKIKRACGKSSITGKTLVWGRFSGCKKMYRKICFFNQDTLGIILFSIYDPNRTSFISAFFNFYSYKFHFVPSVTNIFAGSIIGCQLSTKSKYSLGFRYTLNLISTGLSICLISIKSKKVAQYARSAGTFCQLISKARTVCKLRIPSGLIIPLSPTCLATLGTVSNSFQRLIVVGKAGRNILHGFKSKVRGVAMNPVDHPHGGRTNGGCCWVTPWGKPFLFKKTSNSKIKKVSTYKKNRKKK